MSIPRQFYVNDLRVPFIAPWSREKQPRFSIARRHPLLGGGICYPDERRDDRWNQVLWVRMPAVRGVGKPFLAGVHALRQRQCISHMLCQICGGSTYHSRPREPTKPSPSADERHLFLVRAATGVAITEGERTASPPVHEACAIEAVEDCPHLGKGATASLVEYSPNWGVAGIVYDPETLEPQPGDGTDGLTYVAYEDPRLPWTLAAREVVALHGCTTVDLDELAARVAAAQMPVRRPVRRGTR